jgi:hypothetical protein
MEGAAAKRCNQYTYKRCILAYCPRTMCAELTTIPFMYQMIWFL